MTDEEAEALREAIRIMDETIAKIQGTEAAAFAQQQLLSLRTKLIEHDAA